MTAGAAAVLALALAAPLTARPAEGFASRPEVRQFVSELVQKHGFDAAQLDMLFSRVRRQQSVLRAMAAPAEGPRRSWQSYRSLFLTQERISAGQRFRAANADALARASALYGVPEEIIVAIIGVETMYGRNTGNYRVIDALATLAFDFAPRSDYFRSELEQYLLHARESGVDALQTRGSYAGAMGIPQFMPDSYRRFAVDFDGDGRRDLAGSTSDALGSVGNFLKQHGWKQGEPIAARVRVDGADVRALLEAGIKPAHSVAALAAAGVILPESVPPETLCALIELQSAGQEAEHWAGFDNFYVLTRYNRSSFYAIAVLELARAIAGKEPAPP